MERARQPVATAESPGLIGVLTQEGSRYTRFWISLLGSHRDSRVRIEIKVGVNIAEARNEVLETAEKIGAPWVDSYLEKETARWTAQMFLIFSLGRTDVFPHDDLGVRTALRDNYGLGELPDLETSQRIAAPWRPFASVGSWYCWRALELARRPPDTT